MCYIHHFDCTALWVYLTMCQENVKFTKIDNGKNCNEMNIFDAISMYTVRYLVYFGMEMSKNIKVLKHE